MSDPYRVGALDPTPHHSPYCGKYSLTGRPCHWRPGHTDEHVSGNGMSIVAVWPNTADRTAPSADETPPATRPVGAVDLIDHEDARWVETRDDHWHLASANTGMCRSGNCPGWGRTRMYIETEYRPVREVSPLTPPEPVDQPAPVEKPTRRQHMTYREAAEIARRPGEFVMFSRANAVEFDQAVAVLAELGARTDGPDRPVVVGDRLWSWTAVEALPLGTFVQADSGSRGVRGESAIAGGSCRWSRAGDNRSPSSFPVTVVSLPGDPLPPEGSP